MNLTIESFKTMLVKNKEAKIRITSDSMKPLVHPGDILTVHPIEKTLKRFDIIVFDYYGSPFCHFFWGKVFDTQDSDERIFTRSLKNPNQSDIPILPKDILGIVSNKKIGLFLKTKIYLSLLLRHNGK